MTSCAGEVWSPAAGAAQPWWQPHREPRTRGRAGSHQALAARLLPRVGELASRRAHVRRDRLATVPGLLGTHLPNWRWRVPDGGLALWIELPGADARVFATIAMRQGCRGRPGHTTDPSGAHDSYIRLPFTFPADVLAEVVARLAHSWDQFTRHRHWKRLDYQ